MKNSTGYAPTGINNRQVLLTVIDDPEVMEQLRRKTYSALKKFLTDGTFPEGMEHLEKYIPVALETLGNLGLRDVS